MSAETIHGRRGAALICAAMATSALTAACSAGTTVGAGEVSGSGESCTYAYDFGGRTYVPAVNVDYQVDAKLGSATRDDSCTDGVDDGKPAQTAAYSVKGVSSDYAIVLDGFDEEHLLFVTVGKDKPKRLQEYLDSHHANSPGSAASGPMG